MQKQGKLPGCWRTVIGYSPAAPVRKNKKKPFAFGILSSHPCIIFLLEEKTIFNGFLESSRIPKELRSNKMLPDIFSGAKNKCLLSYIYIINVFYLCSF